MKSLLFCLVIFSIVACKENNIHPDEAIVDASIGLTYVNREGNDLLNPAHEGAYDQNDIKLFYLINRQKVTAFDPNLDNPDHFIIAMDDPSGRYYLGVELNLHKDSTQRSVTYIKLSDSDTDTLVCNFIGNTDRKETVYYNDSLIWTANNNEPKPVVITKEHL